jgi:hypothetical protein
MCLSASQSPHKDAHSVPNKRLKNTCEIHNQKQILDGEIALVKEILMTNQLFAFGHLLVSSRNHCQPIDAIKLKSNIVVEMESLYDRSYLFSANHSYVL